MDKEFKINIWDFVDMEHINEQLDKLLKHKFVPIDIRYNCLKISKDGALTLKVNFKKM